jgi:hypothetical protein
LAMLMSRVCRLGQENAMHANMVASTSLQMKKIWLEHTLKSID